MPLNYRDLGTFGTQLEIISGTLVVSHVQKMVLSGMVSSEARWNWHFRMTGGPLGFQQHGTRPLTWLWTLNQNQVT